MVSPAHPLVSMPPYRWTTSRIGSTRNMKLTRGKRLLQLLGLVDVLENKGVEMSVAADLELDLGSTLGRLL
jgi:hypothetical protein